MDLICIRRPDDFHLHLRRGSVMRAVLPFTEQAFARALIMPNTTPTEIRTAVDAAVYRGEMKEHCRRGFTPLMTIKLLDRTTPH